MAAVSVLNPPLQLLRGTSSDIDNNSIVLEVRVGQLTFLLTGDIMQPAEMEMVLNRLLEPVTVLKVAHHGSGTSSSREFLSVVRPKMAVITVGENEHGHPNPQVLARLAEFTAEQNILRTDLCGRITLLTDGRTLWLKQVDRRSG
jgi:competence protein ComEC